MENFKNWMTEAANIMFDDSKNDLRSLPKSVRPVSYTHLRAHET